MASAEVLLTLDELDRPKSNSTGVGLKIKALKMKS